MAETNTQELRQLSCSYIPGQIPCVDTINDGLAREECLFTRLFIRLFIRIFLHSSL
jgi:hypothetical protein